MTRILFQGDSITDCGRIYDSPTDLGKGYPLLVSARLAFEHPGEYEFFNRGVSGNRVVDMYARIKKDLINLAPDVVSFLIGIMHLFLGVAVKGAMLWKEGKRIDALCETIPIYLTILGVMPTGAGIFMEVPAILSQIGSYVMLVGVALLILTGDRSGKNVFARLFGGLYTLYNAATGWLGDILSYSRLLALGLATGSIAGVVNLICAMPGNLVLKAITLLVVGTAVHVANLAINLLGAYVHSDRLQFVELFSKFYEGGGRAFAPLKANTKNFRFEKENIYHG